MKKAPLDELEVHELLRLCYPEKFPDDSDETYDKAQDFLDELSGYEAIADLLGRVAQCAPTMVSGLSGRKFSALGSYRGETFIAAVKREASHD